MSPALADRFLTTAPPGKSSTICFCCCSQFELLIDSVNEVGGPQVLASTFWADSLIGKGQDVIFFNMEVLEAYSAPGSALLLKAKWQPRETKPQPSRSLQSMGEMGRCTGKT